MAILVQRAAYVVRAADPIERDCDVLIEGSYRAGGCFACAATLRGLQNNKAGPAPSVCAV